MKSSQLNLSASQEQLVVILVLSSIALLVYANSFAVPFQLDDCAVILQNPLIKNAGAWRQLFWFDPTRFLTHLSFALNYSATGFRPFFFHGVNLILHVLNAVGVYWLSGKIMGLARAHSVFLKERSAPRINWPFWAAVLFLCHPVQTESVTYIVQRSVLLAAFFYLSSLLIFLRLKKNFHAGVYALAWVLAVLGSMSKPIFLTLPIMILFFEVCFFKVSLANFQREWGLYLPYGAVFILIPIFLIIFNFHYAHESFQLSHVLLYGTSAADTPRGSYALTQLGVLAQYLKLLFWPVGLNVDYGYKISTCLVEPRTRVGFLIVFFMLALSVALFKRHRLLSFSIGWFFIVLFVESSFFSLPDVIFEHRLYLAVIGFSLALCYILSALPVAISKFVAKNNAGQFYLPVCLSGVVLCFGILSYERNQLWRDPMALLKDSLAKNPDNARPYQQLGYYYAAQGDWNLAEKEYLSAITLKENYRAAHIGLGQVYIREERFTDAARQFQAVLDKEPDNYEVNLQLGEVFSKTGQFESASKQFRKAISLQPESAVSYVALGNVYELLKDYVDAEKFYRKALSIDPFLATGYYGLGNIYLVRRDLLSAQKAYALAIQLNPDYTDAYNGLGIVYSDLRQSELAKKNFETAIELDPQYSVGYLNLARFYKSQNNPAQADVYQKRAVVLKRRMKK